jgi:hypothetical protein
MNADRSAAVLRALALGKVNDLAQAWWDALDNRGEASVDEILDNLLELTLTGSRGWSESKKNQLWCRLAKNANKTPKHEVFLETRLRQEWMAHAWDRMFQQPPEQAFNAWTRVRGTWDTQGRYVHSGCEMALKVLQRWPDLWSCLGIKQIEKGYEWPELMLLGGAEQALDAFQNCILGSLQLHGRHTRSTAGRIMATWFQVGLIDEAFLGKVGEGGQRTLLRISPPGTLLESAIRRLALGEVGRRGRSHAKDVEIPQGPTRCKLEL